MAKGNQDHERAQAIGARIAEARREAGGMSQVELADLLGISERSVQAYEAGEVIPYRYLRELERVLGRPAAWLLHGEAANHVRDEQLDELLGLMRTIEGKLDELLSR